MARELMEVLAYRKWEAFTSVVELAIENIKTVEDLTIAHFFLLEGKSTGGRPSLDYKLSRLACYHIALCCDSRGNDSVKLAKHYFAVKTRQAELAEEKTVTQPEQPISHIDMFWRLFLVRYQCSLY